MSTTQQHDVPADWHDALERGEADLEAGRTVSAELVHERLQGSLRRIDAKRQQRRANASRD